MSIDRSLEIQKEVATADHKTKIENILSPFPQNYGAAQTHGRISRARIGSLSQTPIISPPSEAFDTKKIKNNDK